ncbi:TetR/AcrR family transcriptional regulator [Bdellovibrio sp. HCB337]|uniref:TetR/AcrR family transcriptional regulator n=1 Tax=Bdellovibrio sp. HCB337 TaxID=3394358 RepID=UPI0039A4B7E9
MSSKEVGHRTSSAKSSEDLGAKARILEVAAKLFAEKGLEGTSVRDISKAAGLNLSLISYYFGGKEGLYTELIHNFAQTIRSEIEKVIKTSESKESSKENLERVFMMMVSSFSDIRERYPYMSVIMQRERLAALPFAREIYEETFTPIGESLIQVMVKAQKKGFVRKDLNPLLVFLFLQEAIIGFHNIMACQLQLTQSPMVHTQNFKEFEKQLVTIFVQGIFT